MFLFIDTETTGLPAYRNAPVTDVGAWPHIVQLGWVCTDRFGNQLETARRLVKPDGYVIPPESTRIHGVTHAHATRHGMSLGKVLDELNQTASNAAYVVAHNLAFDMPVVQSAYRRIGIHRDSISALQKRCTMRAAAATWGGQWPTLASTYQRLFGDAPDHAHDALADAIACSEIFFELWERRHISVSGPHPSQYSQEDWDFDNSLFEDIFAAAEGSDWFDTSIFVDSVYETFQRQQWITARQREALEDILDRLT